MKKLVLLPVMLVFCTILNSQTPITFIQPADELSKAYNSYYEGNYEETIKLIDQLNFNDTVYGEALNVKVSAYLKLKQYDKVIETCDYAISIKKGNKLSFLTSKGIALLRNEKYNDAKDAFNKILEEYPYNSTTYYNISLCYYNLGDYAKAIECLETSIIFDPYYAEPHYELGLICLNENLISQALLCFDTYLFLAPESENSLDILVMANNMVSSKQETQPKNIKISADDEAFQETDLILNNYAALNSKYKVINKIPIPFVKQNHALMEKLSGFEGGNDFWQKVYVPFYCKLFKEGRFDILMYRLLASTTVEKYKKIVKKQTGKDKSFVGMAADKLANITGKNIRYDNDKDKQYFYYSSGELLAVGKADENNEFFGNIRYYTKEGRLKSFGDMLKEKKTGDWIYYYKDGTLSSKGKYIDDQPVGEHSEFNTQGYLDTKSNYSNGMLNGDYYSYNNYGVPAAKYFYVDGKLNGPAEFYFSLGDRFIQYDANYIQGEIQGPVTEYFASGEKRADATFQKSNRNGLETKYYRNGQVESKTYYVDGKPDGSYVSYYSSGKLNLQGSYSKGDYFGHWNSYFENGKLESEYNYIADEKLDGDYKQYNLDGNLVMYYLYKNGCIVKYSCYDTKGNVIESGENTKNDFNFRAVYSNGNAYSEGVFNNSGGKDMEWKYYSCYGTITSKETFENSKLTKNEEFYANGSTQCLSFYSDGKREGYSFSNYIDSIKHYEGYYKDGDQYRTWRYYYPNGTLSNEYYYLNDKLEGIQINYAADGKLDSKDFYDKGNKIYSILFDTLGNELCRFNYYTDSTFKHFYPDGKVKAQATYLNGLAHGKALWLYPDGKTETEGMYFNGDRNGQWNWFYLSGQHSSIMPYVYGKIDGTCTNYYENGKTRTIRNYKNDKLEGDYIFYNENGVLTYRATYRNGELNDSAFSFSDDATLEIARIYQDGELVSYSYLGTDGKLLPFIKLEKGTGEVITYFKNGKKARQMKYLSGEIDGKYHSYHSNGQLAEEENYISGVLVKGNFQYYPNGQLKLRCNYINGELNGEYLEYYSTGKLKVKANYLNGKINGIYEYYGEDGNLTKRIDYYNDEITKAEIY
jgi:antitoxin component YwqK of YwqJK toxin-antitoxin module/Tfp pilus assembly protein PilF